MVLSPKYDGIRYNQQPEEENMGFGTGGTVTFATRQWCENDCLGTDHVAVPVCRPLETGANRSRRSERAETDLAPNRRFTVRIREEKAASSRGDDRAISSS